MGDTQQRPIPNSDLTIDTPSKLRAPRAISNPSVIKNSAQPNVPRSKNNSSAVVSPGGRTLRKRKLESSDESIGVKEEDQVASSATVRQPSKKMAVSNVATNTASTTIKSASSVRTTSALAKSKNSVNNSQTSIATAAATKKFNQSGRPGWDTKVTTDFFILGTIGGYGKASTCETGPI